MSSVRFGVLGAARIAPAALVGPANKTPRCSVVAVAARDADRAAQFASRHAIATSTDSYAELVRLEQIDAVYVGLPASLHAHWSIEALRAGKHVLCEKPFATSAEEAEEMVAVARERGRVLCEAFHYAYHPLARRVREICASGAIGELRRLEARFDAPIGDTEDIRYILALGGGATMDLGCYPIHQMRTIAAAEPVVVSAEASERPSGVDEVMTAEFRFPTGVSGRMHCSMSKEGGFGVSLDVEGSRGALHVTNLIAPGLGYELKWHNADGEFDEKVEADGSTFDYQMAEFVAGALDGKSLPTGGQDAIDNMRAIDAVYRAAGLPPRRA